MPKLYIKKELVASHGYTAVEVRHNELEALESVGLAENACGQWLTDLRFEDVSQALYHALFIQRLKDRSNVKAKG